MKFVKKKTYWGLLCLILYSYKNTYNNVYFIDPHKGITLSALDPFNQWAATKQAQHVGTVLCSGVSQGSLSVDSNPRPSDHGATTPPTEHFPITILVF